jgi:hypothetical protein
MNVASKVMDEEILAFLSSPVPVMASAIIPAMMMAWHTASRSMR